MNNLSSYCGLTDSRMNASDTDLPVNQSELRPFKYLLRFFGHFGLNLNFHDRFQFVPYFRRMNNKKNRERIGKI